MDAARADSENTLDSIDLNDELVRRRLIEFCALTLEPALARIRAHSVSGDLRAYLPGQRQFVCAQAACTHSCCKAHDSTPFQVPISRRFREAVSTTRGIADSQFVILEDGLPGLARSPSGECVFLDNRHQCTVYDIRPVSCAAYPFDLAIFDLQRDGRLAKLDHWELFRKAGEAAPMFFTKNTLGYGCIVPLITYHSKCPGFTGQPIGVDEYLSIVDRVWDPLRRGLIIEPLS
jgi:Fe-S-cluster containining protein